MQRRIRCRLHCQTDTGRIDVIVVSNRCNRRVPARPGEANRTEEVSDRSWSSTSRDKTRCEQAGFPRMRGATERFTHHGTRFEKRTTRGERRDRRRGSI
eukprot:1003067-Prymnesium_polylepis.2